MPDVPLTNLVNRNGLFVTKEISASSQINSGSSGVLFNITCASNERVMLEFLYANADTPEPDLTLTVGSTDVVSGGTLDDRSGILTIGTFGVGVRTGNAGDRKELYGGVGQSVTLTKDSGTTSEDIRYAYRIGVVE